MYKLTPSIIESSELRTEITGLSHPEKDTMYIVVKHGDPQFLIWPVSDIVSISDRHRLFLRAVKARNEIRSLEAIKVLPDTIPRTTMTELRRAITQFLQRMALLNMVGFVTNYDQIVAVYVPLTSMAEARKFIAEINRQEAGHETHTET